TGRIDGRRQVGWRPDGKARDSAGLLGRGNRRWRARVLEHLHLLADQVRRIQILGRKLDHAVFVDRYRDEVHDAKEREKRLRRRAYGRDAEQTDDREDDQRRRGNRFRSWPLDSRGGSVLLPKRLLQ